VQSINVVAINQEPESEVDIVDIVENAKRYFPTEAWDEIRYWGKLNLEHDVKVLVDKQCLAGFLFERLIRKFRNIMDQSGLKSLLLGITSDPIVATSYFFDDNTFKRAVYLVHDYVTEKLGVVSLFSVDEESSSKVVAHGLGHNRGLRHHEKPADLMHPQLLRLPRLQVNGFCKLCLRELTENKNS
jgi:predicted Zn-dependent protease